MIPVPIAGRLAIVIVEAVVIVMIPIVMTLVAIVLIVMIPVVLSLCQRYANEQRHGQCCSGRKPTSILHGTSV
jgi:multidrug efflux pump subunit AcrB